MDSDDEEEQVIIIFQVDRKENKKLGSLLPIP